MISDKMKKMVSNNSVIREMFEEGKKLKKIYGEDNVFDFSLGNPSTKPPKEVNEAIKKSLEDENIHAYMSNSGFDDVRKTIADSINKKNETNLNENNIIMCVGAAGGLNVALKSILNPNDEVIVLIPYFMEYRNYIDNFNGKIVEVGCNSDFEPDMIDFEKKINENTKAVIINNPNNPSGTVYSEKVIQNITNLLKRKEAEYNKAIYLISDEPYREIVFDDAEVLFLPKYYNDTIVVYSYSKSLSLPGERIGYITLPSSVDDFEDLVQAMSIATRILGFVNAPSLLQKAIAECVNMTSDMTEYKTNRDILYNGLIECGYECKKPQGAFYLFLKSPMEDEKEFCNLAKKYNILMVPGSSFACPGYVRLAFCTETKTVKNSIPKFKDLKNEIDRMKADKNFALIGYPLGHSMSPIIHSELLNKSSLNGCYKLKEIKPEELNENNINELKKLNGFNITIPHKINIIKYLDELSTKAELFGSVNTVHVDGVKMIGYNTDCIGFHKALEDAKIKLEGKVLICGSGGVSRMFAYESAIAGADVTLAVRDSSLEAAKKIQEEIKNKLYKECRIVKFEEISGEFDLIINGTPVGMYPNTCECVITKEVVKSAKAVFDSIYNPLETKLIKYAKELGIKYSNGLSMLVWQAVAAEEIWNNIKFSKEDVQDIIKKIEQKMKEGIN